MQGTGSRRRRTQASQGPRCHKFCSAKAQWMPMTTRTRESAAVGDETVPPRSRTPAPLPNLRKRWASQSAVNKGNVENADVRSGPASSTTPTLCGSDFQAAEVVNVCRPSQGLLRCFPYLLRKLVRLRLKARQRRLQPLPPWHVRDSSAQGGRRRPNLRRLAEGFHRPQMRCGL